MSTESEKRVAFSSQNSGPANPSAVSTAPLKSCLKNGSLYNLQQSGSGATQFPSRTAQSKSSGSWWSPWSYLPSWSKSADTTITPTTPTTMPSYSNYSTSLPGFPAIHTASPRDADDDDWPSGYSSGMEPTGGSSLPRSNQSNTNNPYSNAPSGHADPYHTDEPLMITYNLYGGHTDQAQSNAEYSPGRKLADDHRDAFAQNGAEGWLRRRLDGFCEAMDRQYRKPMTLSRYASVPSSMAHLYEDSKYSNSPSAQGIHSEPPYSTAGHTYQQGHTCGMSQSYPNTSIPESAISATRLPPGTELFRLSTQGEQEPRYGLRQITPGKQTVTFNTPGSTGTLNGITGTGGSIGSVAPAA